MSIEAAVAHLRQHYDEPLPDDAPLVIVLGAYIEQIRQLEALAARRGAVVKANAIAAERAALGDATPTCSAWARQPRFEPSGDIPCDTLTARIPGNVPETAKESMT